MIRPLAILLLAGAIAAVEVPAQVVSVHDGDTITVLIDGEKEHIRLLYIDTPEVTDNKHGVAMAEGTTARDDLRQLLPAGAAVTLWGPRDALEIDPFRRLLAVVEVGETSAQERMVHDGWSAYWRKYGQAADPWHAKLLQAQADAKTAGAGMWTINEKWIVDKTNERTAPKKRRD